MKLEKYVPSSRYVLFREVRETITKGGIHLPPKGFTVTAHSEMFEKEKQNTVTSPGKFIIVKTGPDCSPAPSKGREILVSPGCVMVPIDLEGENDLFQVMEQQILGYGDK